MVLVNVRTVAKLCIFDSGKEKETSELAKKVAGVASFKIGVLSFKTELISPNVKGKEKLIPGKRQRPLNINIIGFIQ